MPTLEHLYIVKDLTRDDLLDCRPDASDRIDTLSETQMQQIAEQVGKVLHDAYRTALASVLMRYLPPQPDENPEDED